MSYQNAAMKAYADAQFNFNKAEKAALARAVKSSPQPVSGFAATFADSLSKVNDMQQEKNTMIQAFASGENQNVHELMIALQKAGLAVNMTSAVRNKLMEAYRELSKIQF